MIPDANFTLLAAKAHLRVTHDAEDALILAMLDAGVGACEEYCGVAFTDRTNIEVRVPLGCTTAELPMARAKLPLDVKYLRDDNTMQPWPGSVLVKTQSTGEQSIELSGHPTDYHADADAAAVVLYTAQPAPAPVAVPPAVVAAAHLQLGHLYNLREAYAVGTIIALNPTSVALLDPYRINWGV